MIIFFGPAGAGKSVQGQMLATKMGWRWLSAGQLLRDTHDIEILSSQQKGELVDSDKVNKIIYEALSRSVDIKKVILDGFPRQLGQASWLVDNQPDHGRSISAVVVLDISNEEVFERLKLRGRVDDNPEVIQDRLEVYKRDIYPILDYFTDKGINIIHVDGIGTINQVHDRIVKELAARKII